MTKISKLKMISKKMLGSKLIQ